MRFARFRAPAAAIVCLLTALPMSAVQANQLQPVPGNPVDRALPGPPVVIEAQPSVGQPLSTTQDASAVSIHLISQHVAKAVAGGKHVNVPLGEGEIQGVAHFPVAVDAHATSVTLQQTPGDDGSWQVELSEASSPDEVAFVLRGTAVADLAVQLQPPLGAVVHFGVRITPTAVITLEDAGGRVQFKQGERFSVALPEGYTWTSSVPDETIVRRVQDDPAVFEALQPGSTILLLSGEPACYRLRPGCRAPSLDVEVQLDVA